MGASARETNQEFGSGVLLVDKPVGVSSFAMVQKVRRLSGIKKVGHAGTLDPFASGLLIICVGRPATRNIESFMQGNKNYVATLRLGMETTTLDPEGDVTATFAVPELEAEDIDRCLACFKGKQMQAPPAYSAAKYKGKPLYHYARKGIVIEKEPKGIEIYDIKRLGHTTDTIEISVSCSRGTYIRVLAADIARKLNCGGYLTQLRRIGSGHFRVDEAVSGQELREKMTKEQLAAALIPLEAAVKATETRTA